MCTAAATNSLWNGWCCVQVLKMKDDELSPLDDALEQIEDLLRGLGVQDQMVREFVRNAPVAASIFWFNSATRLACPHCIVKAFGVCLWVGHPVVYLLPRCRPCSTVIEDVNLWGDSDPVSKLFLYQNPSDSPIFPCWWVTVDICRSPRRAVLILKEFTCFPPSPPPPTCHTFGDR